MDPRKKLKIQCMSNCLWLLTCLSDELHSDSIYSDFLGFFPQPRPQCLLLIHSFRLQKQTGPPDAGNNLWKGHFIMCHMTKYSTIRGVFQQPWPGVSSTAIFNEEKALGTGLFFPQFNFFWQGLLTKKCSKCCAPATAFWKRIFLVFRQH